VFTLVSGRRRTVAPVVLGLIAAPLSVLAVAGPAQAAPVEITLLNINDYHGRIQGDVADNPATPANEDASRASTVEFATTIETIRAAQGEANTLFLSAGDNIGASLFASSLAEDQPTIDVLNALELAGSAVGNHEFDRGFADLEGRVQDEADFDYLGANVYEAGTDTPALDEYATYEVAGVTVGVIGTVTEQTPSLVSPAGIADIEFGDPVEATNRVAAQLSDGNPANGEADLIVAEYHEGAGDDAETFDQAVAESEVFDAIANETSAAVDVIFTGHTHAVYVFDAPVPGVAGETRPIVQTGSYGANIGQVDVTVDDVTGEVSAYTADNVMVGTAEDLTRPRVQEVDDIVQAALDAAAEIGNQPVGEITDDITTAFTEGTYGPDGYTVPDSEDPPRDDRAAESTLGGLVANALRDGVAEFAEPDLGLTNPGGLRDELYFAGETGENPANTDGVVTFSEANEVLPFNNTVAIVELTGAELKQVLEQQWQTNADGTTASRPYLQLGLSDNVRVTADPTNAAGSRITSVLIDDEPLDLAQTYTISTLSFLATGGDNFRAFNDGTFVDTGLLDAELWRTYLADNSPLSPDFARQQVFTDGMPASVAPGQRVTFDLGRATGGTDAPLTGTTLDLTSLGSPANETVTATLVDGTSETVLGEFDVVDGVSTIDLTVPASASTAAVIEMVAQPSGTTVTLPVAAGAGSEKVTPRMQVTAPKQVRKGKRPLVEVALFGKGAGQVRGEVRFVDRGESVAKKVTNGTVQLRLEKLRKKTTVKVVYLGNDTFDRVRKTVTIKVRKK
jgi:5'-nucleotidase